MTCDPGRHHRRSIRLPGYDYSQAGAYFVTICTHDRARLFGEVVHGEMRLNACGRRDSTKPVPLSEVIRAFKTFSARRINKHRDTQGAPVWQRNYYEHIIRDDKSLNRIREYIASNPPRRATDRENRRR